MVNVAGVQWRAYGAGEDEAIVLPGWAGYEALLGDSYVLGFEVRDGGADEGDCSAAAG